MLSYNKDAGAVCDESGQCVLRVTDWSIDQELYANVHTGDAVWRIIARQKKVADSNGSLRLGWEVFKVGGASAPIAREPPLDLIAAALKAYGYSNGRGSTDDVPVKFV